MARQSKVGLDYFDLDCQLGEKVRLIQAEFGLKGFAVVVKLYQKIYGELGYYCEWSEDSLLLFMSENGVPSDSKNLIREIVSACIRRGIFSERLFNEFGILTSSGVQERYLNATSRREKVELKKEYLLISVGEKNKNAVINSVNADRNSVNDSRNSQSREEKSKEENKNTMRMAEARALFERLWKLYPVKKGKARVSEAQKLRLLESGYDEMSRAIERYIQYVERSGYLHYQHGSTFFNSGYVDYLDENYEPGSSDAGRKSSKKNKFTDYPSRDYDFEAIKRQMFETREG
ncbi:MAG: DUF4373 domain-containing protein [Lachnospiraceae bacterium]|nr:DUF4373 domain-containing protein [Lachnospiraceae bacterium]